VTIVPGNLSCSLVVAVAALGLHLQAADNADASDAADLQSRVGGVSGITRAPGGTPLTSVKVVLHGVEENTDLTIVSGGDGAFHAQDLKPGQYQLTAKKDGFITSPVTIVEVAPRQSANVDITLGASIVAPARAPGGFFKRFAQAYLDDWHPKAGENGPEPKYRGYPAPVSNPPYPFTVWPYGGSVTLGQPYTSTYPLMTAIYGGKNGKAWQDSKIQFYGWANLGMNISTSTHGPYANSPAAYNQIPNSFQPDQMVLYIERQPDTVQTDHFDWGFRLTSLWGLDYRFTTSKGILSQQLLNNPKPDGSIGNKYGYDPVMAYVDLYFPKVAQGLDLRIGRYVSLPDIEAQLAPNNYTYTHSLTYVYDCYTQDGINGTFKLSNHWIVQLGLSAGCDAAPWTKEGKLTGNVCVGYTWTDGGDNIYTCANSINDSRYSYNNLAAYYLTWYHKFGTSSWHTATESWYQYESHTPNVNNPDAASLILTNANGAWCKNPSELTCFAPEWAILNYTNKQFGKHDFISFRNEYFDDIKGQRTGFKTRYTEHGISWNHWIGTTAVFRPEIRYEHAYDYPAYSTGTKKTQLMFAGDVIWFF